jgi:L-ribulose-5-phosphate 4-epimerase
MDEGYIKFNCEWVKSKLNFDISIMNHWRDNLFDLKLIGAYDNGIGYGNISVRTDDGFVISGSTTGNLRKLNIGHYSKVIAYDFNKNFLKCVGPIKASSESMSHAAVYESNPKINAVIHVHNLDLWTKLLNKVPTTSKNAKYGTPEMAYEIKKLFKETKVFNKKIFVMKGHKEGIFCFGNDLNEASKVLLDLV